MNRPIMASPILIKVDGMGCQSCVSAVAAAVRGVAPEAAVEVSLSEGTVRIANSGTPRERFETAIVRAGYDIAG